MTEPLVTLITTTGFRPEAFELCKKYVESQTYQGPIQWIIVSDSVFDSDFPKKENLKFSILEGIKQWSPGINTQRYNLDLGLNSSAGEYILFWEDDDYYSPRYIENMVSLLNIFPAVGEGNAKYYNLPNKCWKEQENYQHASLCQTGIKRELLNLADRAINSGEIYIDIVMWKLIREEKIPHLIFNNVNMAIGIKGMPGRPGIGVGHRPIGFISDISGNKLKSWIGKDFELYEPYLGTAIRRPTPPVKEEPSPIYKSNLIY